MSLVKKLLLNSVKVTYLLLLLPILGCSRTEYRPQVAAPPCVVAPWPELQKVDAFMCGDAENQYVCMTALSVSHLAAYLEAVEDWHDSLKGCEQVTEAVPS